MTSARTDVVVVGGGIIGLSIAWRLAQRGVGVVVCDLAPGSGATYAAAGMLAPVAEARWGDKRLLDLGIASLARWPSFAAELADCAGMDLDLHSDGILLVALDSDDNEILADYTRLHETCRLSSERLASRECRQIEPALAPGIRGGLLAKSDMAVDPRIVSRALEVALQDAGGHLERTTVQELSVGADRRRGAVLADGRHLEAGLVILAAGAWSRQISGIPEEALPPIRPVKGQILRLRGLPNTAPLLKRPVHAIVHGFTVYLVPRRSGELVVGATQEELGFDKRVTGRGAYELLRDAIAILPDVGELELTETLAGFRPTTPDNLPIIGPSVVDGLVLATGHHRNGILLAPITADIVTEIVAHANTVEIARQFSPDRFSPLGLPIGLGARTETGDTPVAPTDSTALDVPGGVCAPRLSPARPSSSRLALNADDSPKTVHLIPERALGTW